MSDVPDSAPAPRRSAAPMIIAVLVGVAAMIAFVFLHLSRDGRVHTGAAPAHADCGAGDCLPDLAYVDTQGVAYPRSALAGKIVLVNFWATWCRPCEREIPDLSRTYEKYKAKGVLFLGVLTDKPDNQQLLNFQSDHDMRYPVVRATPELMDAYHHPDAFPTTIVYDRAGKQIYNHVGALREHDLDAVFANLLGQS